MNELSLFDDEIGKKTVTTKELAEVLCVDVKTVNNTVERLGGLLGTTFQKSYGGRPTKVFNEEQATLIKQEIQKHHNLSSRKIDDVSTDYEMEIMTQKVIAYHIQKANEYKQRAEIAEKQLLEQKPMVDGYQTFLASHSSFTMQKASAMLKDGNGVSPYGRNNLIKKLKLDGIFMSNGLPYRDFIDRGYFEVRTSVHNGMSHDSTLVFPKGMDYLAKKLGLIVEYGQVA